MLASQIKGLLEERPKKVLTYLDIVDCHFTSIIGLTHRAEMLKKKNTTGGKETGSVHGE